MEYNLPNPFNHSVESDYALFGIHDNQLADSQFFCIHQRGEIRGI